MQQTSLTCFTVEAVISKSGFLAFEQVRMCIYTQARGHALFQGIQK